MAGITVLGAAGRLLPRLAGRVRGPAAFRGGPGTAFGGAVRGVWGGDAGGGGLSFGGLGGSGGGAAFTPNAHRRNLPANFGVRIVPEQQADVVERFGSYSRTLSPGLHLLIPLVDQIRYVHSLKEQTLSMHAQNAITRDNVAVQIDGVLYVQITDARKASYGVEDPLFAVMQLAQTAMRSELGKITLDKMFEERDALNTNIVRVINEASIAWGIQCLRYEIRDIAPPEGVKKAMELQAEAERRKRARVLESEGEKQSRINIAEGAKAEKILNSEAAMQEQINSALGEAEAILRKAGATAEGLERVSTALQGHGGGDAAALRVAEQYVEAFGKLAKEANTVLLPANASDPASMVTQALSVYKALGAPPGGPPPAPSGPTQGASGGGEAQTGPAAANPLKATPGAQGRAAPARKLGFSLAKQ